MTNYKLIEKALKLQSELNQILIELARSKETPQHIQEEPPVKLSTEAPPKPQKKTTPKTQEVVEVKEITHSDVASAFIDLVKKFESPVEAKKKIKDILKKYKVEATIQLKPEDLNNVLNDIKEAA